MTVFVPPHFATRDRIAIARLMHDNAFATLITPGDPEPAVTHLPLMWLADCEPNGTLIGHFARNNPHVDAATAGESIAIFHGPHAYVSPSFYADPAASVPTWNYAVVHAHGSIVLSSDRAGTQAILDTLIHRFESTRAAPWQLGLGPAVLNAMVGAIIGFRMRIKRIDAKFKLSQNRSDDDRARVIAALDSEGYPEAAATSAWMRAYAAPADDER